MCASLLLLLLLPLLVTACSLLFPAGAGEGEGEDVVVDAGFDDLDAGVVGEGEGEGEGDAGGEGEGEEDGVVAFVDDFDVPVEDGFGEAWICSLGASVLDGPEPGAEGVFACQAGTALVCTLPSVVLQDFETLLIVDYAGGEVAAVVVGGRDDGEAHVGAEVAYNLPLPGQMLVRARQRDGTNILNSDDHVFDQLVARVRWRVRVTGGTRVQQSLWPDGEPEPDFPQFVDELPEAPLDRGQVLLSGFAFNEGVAIHVDDFVVLDLGESP